MEPFGRQNDVRRGSGQPKGPQWAPFWSHLAHCGIIFADPFSDAVLDAVFSPISAHFENVSWHCGGTVVADGGTVADRRHPAGDSRLFRLPESRGVSDTACARKGRAGLG